MRLALQRRLLASLSTKLDTYRAAHLDSATSCHHYYHSTTIQEQPKSYTAKESGREQLLASETRAFRIRKFAAAVKDDRKGKGTVERSKPDAPKAPARLPNARNDEDVVGAGLSLSAAQPDIQLSPLAQHDVHSSNPSSRTDLRLPSEARRITEGWRGRLVTLEQYQHESNLEALTFRTRLVDEPSYSQDWELWLELIVFRRRHHGAKGTVAIYKEIYRRDLRLPTEGIVADQLWDLLIRAGFHDYELLEKTVIYATRLKWSTKRSWSKMYYGIVSITLQKDPDSAYSWHVKLRDDFPPSPEDYQKIFKLSLDWGRSAHFRGLYMDTPLVGMYKTVIRPLCELQMYADALKWHDILLEAGDFPTDFSDIQSLLYHIVYIGDRPRFERIVRQLAEAKIPVANMAENFVQEDMTISPEIMNRQLGEVHGFAPKHLSDSFCARLFATRLFSVDTVINGLHMMATETIGPLSLREIAVRDNCDPGAICQHIDVLRNAGFSLENSAFCTIVRSLAVENKRGILESVVNSDLHPDTFADLGLQEQLLAQYYKENDLVKIERTVAVLTTGYSVENLQMARVNLGLRCQITLGRREKVLAILEEMKHTGIQVSARSSRHLRVCWLSRRQVGRGAAGTQELTILIQASRMTMESGGFVPIIAWREILRRLGMAGRLTELENLALWLVDWYSSPAAKAALSRRISLPSHGGQALIAGHVPQGKSQNRDPRRFLNTLFTTAARHAIVAWGFQHFTKTLKSVRRLNESSMAEDSTRFQWTWGLHLLYKLRERGLPVKRSEVARICRHRLNTLFGAGFSKRKINERARAENRNSERVYIRKMEEIWGKGLFRVWRHVGRNLEKRMGRKHRRVRRRLKRHECRADTDACEAE